jgi:hypothetical protein
MSHHAGRGLAVMRRYSLVAILAVLSLSLTACAGGGDEEVAQPGTTPQPTSSAEVTPARTPTITDNLFEFPDGGYSVRFPEGWSPRANFLPGPGFTVDAFFAPQEVEKVQPNIAVTCEQVPEGMSLKEYSDRKVEVAKQVTKEEPEVTSREVSGQEAMQLRYTREERIAAPIEKTEVVFITDRCGWDIALTAPFSERVAYRDLFNEFLGSFSLLP